MSVGGVGNQEYIEQLLYIEARPLRELQSRKDDLSARLGILSDVRSRVDTFKGLLSGFAEVGILSALRQYGVTSPAGETSSVRITPSAAATTGTHSISVQALAQTHMIQSAALVGGSSGGVPAGTHTFEIIAGPDAERVEVTVTIDAGDTNETAMSKVVSAIDNATELVDAALVTTNTIDGSKRITLRSGTAGSAGTIQSIADVSGSLMTTLGLAGTTASFDELQAGQDAQFTLDGVQVVSDKNEISGVVDGITISLLSVSEAPETFTVGYDKEQVKEKVTALLDAYNELIGYLNTKMSSGDETGAGRGELAGDLTFITFKNTLIQEVSRGLASEFAIDGINSLDDVGFSIARDGKLTLTSENDFFEALEGSPDGVEAFFGSEGGVATRLEELVKAFTKSGGGSICRATCWTREKTCWTRGSRAWRASSRSARSSSASRSGD